MPAGGTDLLEAMAVLGSADLRVAAAVAGIDGETAGQLADALADVGVLGWERPLVFVHPFERHSVYAEMPRARRAGLTPMLHRSWPDAAPMPSRSPAI